MNNHIDGEGTYVAFEVKNHSYAVPVNDILGTIIGRPDMACTVVPNAQKNIKYIVEMNGQFITVVQMPGIEEAIPMIGNYIVMLKHTDHIIGILANRVNHITTATEQFFEDVFTGQKSFAYNGKIYFVLDACQFVQELGI